MSLGAQLYLGMAEVTPDELRLEVEIDNLDRMHWRGELHSVAMRAELRRARIVEIRLLEGDRTGEHATCVVVDDDGWPTVLGRTSFHQ